MSPYQAVITDNMCVCRSAKTGTYLSTHMPLTDIGWGIIYPPMVHDEHPDILAYDKLAGISDIVMGEQPEPDDPDAEERRKRQLTHVKREEAELRDGRANPTQASASTQRECRGRRQKHTRRRSRGRPAEDGPPLNLYNVRLYPLPYTNMQSNLF